MEILREVPEQHANVFQVSVAQSFGFLRCVELLDRLPPTYPRSADRVERFAFRAAPAPHDRIGIEGIQRHQAGRLGVDIHATAGKGDLGFCNHWTLEISVKKPVRLYAGMPIGQLIYFTVQGKVSVPYGKKRSAKYAERSDQPVASMMWKNFP